MINVFVALEQNHVSFISRKKGVILRREVVVVVLAIRIFQVFSWKVQGDSNSIEVGGEWEQTCFMLG